MAEGFKTNCYMNNTYMYFTPQYDFEGDDMLGALADSAKAIENVYDFTLYVFINYKKKKDTEHIFHDFDHDWYKDMIAYMRVNRNYFYDDIKEYCNQVDDIDMLSHLKEELDSVQGGDANSWEEVVEASALPYRNLACYEKVDVYRFIAIGQEEEPDLDNLGNCWAYCLEGALYFDNHILNKKVENGKRLLIEASVNSDCVDWVTSVLARLRYPKECELRLIPNYLVESNSIPTLEVRKVYDLNKDELPWEYNSLTGRYE